MKSKPTALVVAENVRGRTDLSVFEILRRLVVLTLCEFRLTVPLRSWKAGRFLLASILLTVRPIVTCGSRGSRAPPHHTLPTFLNLHGSTLSVTFILTFQIVFSPKILLTEYDLFNGIHETWYTCKVNLALCNVLKSWLSSFSPYFSNICIYFVSSWKTERCFPWERGAGKTPISFLSSLARSVIVGTLACVFPICQNILLYKISIKI